MNVKKARELAHKESLNLKYEVNENPIKTLKTIQFNIPVESGSIAQKEIALKNIKLCQSSCLGRTAQSAAIIERHHPNCIIEVAEVWKDSFQCIMLQKLSKNPRHAHDKSFMQELLLYEEPHSILIIDGVQFDPLSIVFGTDIVHPKINTYPLWESIAASILIAESHLTNLTFKKLNILHRADTICPGLTTVAENIVEPYLSSDNIDKAMKNLLWALGERPCARALYCAYIFTAKQEYYFQLIETYSSEIIKHMGL